MKTRILSFLTCFFFTTGFAQQVTLKKEVVYKDEVPFCRLVKQGSGLMPRLSVRSLEAPEDELIAAQYNEAQRTYLVSFLESGAVSNMRATPGIAELFAEDLVYNKVLVGGKISPTGEALFLRQHQSTTEAPELLPGLKKAITGIEDAVSEILTDGPPVKRTTDDKRYETVERDHLKPIVLRGETILQDNQVIGRYTITQPPKKSTSAQMNEPEVLSFWLPGGQKIAEATLDYGTSASARILLLKTDQVVTLSVTNLTQASQIQKIAIYLSGRFLL
jgi:hypothetical protein